MSNAREETHVIVMRARWELQTQYRAYLRAASDAWTWQEPGDLAEARARRSAAAGIAWILTGAV